MVKAIKDNKGRLFLTIPKVIQKKKKWRGGEEFVPQFDQEGNLVYIEVKE